MTASMMKDLFLGWGVEDKSSRKRHIEDVASMVGKWLGRDVWMVGERVSDVTALRCHAVGTQGAIDSRVCGKVDYKKPFSEVKQDWES